MNVVQELKEEIVDLKKKHRRTLIKVIGGALVLTVGIGIACYYFGKKNERENIANDLDKSGRLIFNTSHPKNLNYSISTQYGFHDFSLAADKVRGKIDNDYVQHQMYLRAKNTPKYTE